MGNHGLKFDKVTPGRSMNRSRKNKAFGISIISMEDEAKSLALCQQKFVLIQVARVFNMLCPHLAMMKYLNRTMSEKAILVNYSLNFQSRGMIVG